MQYMASPQGGQYESISETTIHHDALNKQQSTICGDDEESKFILHACFNFSTNKLYLTLYFAESKSILHVCSSFSVDKSILA